MKYMLLKTGMLFASLSFPGAIVPVIGSSRADMVEIFCYASSRDNGRGGLRVAVRNSPDSAWQILNGGRGIVRSDFGAHKPMHEPRLSYDGKIWTAIWFLDKEHTGIATTWSEDMTVWQPQRYSMIGPGVGTLPTSMVNTSVSIEKIGMDSITGYKAMVPRSAISSYYKAADEKGRSHKGDGERMTSDSITYQGLKPVAARISIDCTQSKKGSDKLIGAFFEDLNYAADGGLYAELIQNRDFEYSVADINRDPAWGPMYGWEVVDEKSNADIMKESPVHPNNPHYLHLQGKGGKGRIINRGYEGIPVKGSEKYDFSMFCRAYGEKPMKVEVILRDSDGTTLSKETCDVAPGVWATYRLTLTPTVDSDSAMLDLSVPAGKTADFDMVSLFPRNTFRNRSNGLRADLAQAIADIRPKFLRFPGGCLVHGDGLDNIYNWKETIGPLETRKPAPNIWRYHQTRGLGYFEYFQFCEDIGAEPLPVVAAGVSCQNSGIAGPSSHSHDLITSYGQMGGLPMEDMEAYIQDVLDLIEWANGDTDTEWGAVRAAAGHPEPFGLKYIGLGNEDLISEEFKERFLMIYNAVKERYPEIKVIGTSGPAMEGSDYEAGWEFARQCGVDLVDEHSYAPTGWFINNQDFYDKYPRSGPGVYIGEYVARVPGNRPTVESALATAQFLMNVERNSDVVKMTSYAPLLARHGFTQWNPDLIYFDNKHIYPTTDYEIQRLFGNNSGDTIIRSGISIDGANPEVMKRLNVSTLVDSSSGDMIIKILNCLPVALSADINIPDNGFTRVSKTVFGGKLEERTGGNCSHRVFSTGNSKG